MIDGSLIHHTLNAANGRTDAHGIVAGAARRLTIRNTEIHTFSGDAFQIDPGRASPGWGDVVIEGCRFWLQPLPAAVNGFAAGVVPGEKRSTPSRRATMPRATLTIRNSEFYGFRAGLITNMAAFNIKENVDTVVDGVTIHSSEIAFRLRAPALVRVQNAVVHTVSDGVRYEDNIQSVRIWNSTFGAGVTRRSRRIVVGQRPRYPQRRDLRRRCPARRRPMEPRRAGFCVRERHEPQLSVVAGSPASDHGMTIAEVT